METHKDRIDERKRVREMRRARIERGTGDVPEETGKNNEQVAVRQADASGERYPSSQKRIRDNERRRIGRMNED